MSQEYNPDALVRLFNPWEEPNKYRKRNPLPGQPAIEEPGRRPSRCRLVPHLRHEVAMWRQNGYIGASDTTKTLLNHWFETGHPGEFRYHFCQREAIETIIWLYEVKQYRDLSSMVSSLLEDNTVQYEALIKGITPDEDAWARYCCKIATAGGKTKVMSLAIAWSYFHKMFEPDSQMPQHFVAIAPNLIVFERLKTDFGSDNEAPAIFYSDPVLPPEWKDDFSLQVVMQDDAGGGSYTGTLYLTNIHRLYERDSANSDEGTPPWAGPEVKRATALKVGEALRKRIAEHPSIMVLNDEAHHLHDPESAWNDAIRALNVQSIDRRNAGVLMQLDFTATPKHNDGSLFKHIVCDFPLGEAVDAGIVKVPVIGKSSALKERSLAQNAYHKWEVHLKLGYEQYRYAFEEWQKSRKPILFVMTENTTAANEIASALDSDAFPLLKGRVINLHTKLKGRVKRVQRGGREVAEFVENENQMSDDDLKFVRELSRGLDSEDSPYRCVVSVLMLREGWDIRNVTTIVPLRPYSADSGILPEQTLGRGLRRMTQDALERVTVVEHEAFVHLYEEELAEEGVLVNTTDLNGPKPESVSIYVDPKKPVGDLEIELPQVSDSISTTATLEGLTFESVRDYFKQRFSPLPILKPRTGSITFEERALFTDELVASWNIDRGLLAMSYSAVGVFVRELEKACRLVGASAALLPLVQRFIEEVLFEKAVTLYDGSVDHRMADPDVAEHIRATFAPLILKCTVKKTDRRRDSAAVRVSDWRPYQATSTARHPCVPGEKTIFNLVPCHFDLETQFVDFCDASTDVAAFAKNSGPQKLMIDYIMPNGRPAFYVPDFLVRLQTGDYYLVETKGQTDDLVPLKAKAAIEWCAAASDRIRKWQYVFVPMTLFEANTELSLESLARTCAPRLKSLLESLETKQGQLSLETTPEEVKKERSAQALSQAGVAALPESIQMYVDQAVNQLAYIRTRNYGELGSAFNPLLYPFEQLCGEAIQKYLCPLIPSSQDDRIYYFSPYLDDQTPGVRGALSKNQLNLQKLLVYQANCNRIGTLLFCIDYANTWDIDIGGIWRDVRSAFKDPAIAGLYPDISAINQFRNKHVAHVDEPLTDAEVAEKAMTQWIQGIAKLHGVVHS